MREEESIAHYLSPLVKQDLAKLDADGDSRQLALKSLKQFIDQLDATSMPKFLSQIAESRESGGSRAYAISLYEEVARVHRKLIKPHLPRVMSSVIRALAASGSSPQLQQACAKVTAAMARYTIDPAMSIENAEDIIQTICDPLAEALIGKLEPVTTGAAACIHALIEAKNWKYASKETIHVVCQRVTVALSEKSTQTVFHLQLASALTWMNPDTLSLYGAAILRRAAKILRTSIDSWQQRKAAAKLLQGVLIILDKETLEIEVDLAIHALESCRLDKMPHVRLAVREALYTAKMLASGDSSQTCSVLSYPLLRSISTSMELGSSPWTKRDIKQTRNLWSKEDMDRCQSPWTKESLLSSQVQKQIISPTSQESNQLSFSPASTSTTESMHIKHPVRFSNSRKLKQTPLYLARSLGFAPSSRCSTPGTLSPLGSIFDDCKFTAQQSKAKENMPMRTANANGALSSEEFEQLQVPIKANVLAAAPFTNTLIPNLQLDKFVDENHTPKPTDRDFVDKLIDQSVPHVRKDTPDCMILRNVMNPMVFDILDEFTEAASNILEEDDVVLALLDNQIEKSCNVKPNYRKGDLPQLQLGFDINCPDQYVTGNPIQSLEHPTMQQNEDCSVDWNANKCMEECKNVESRGVNLAATNSMEHLALECDKKSYPKLLKGSGLHKPFSNLKHHCNALTHLDFSHTKSQLTQDSLSFATPKQLMRALQLLNCAILDSKRVSTSEDVALCKHNATVLDVDVEASSEAGLSVRDNPIASDNSFGADTSDDKLEDRLKFPFKDSQLQSILLSDSHDIHISSYVEKAMPHQQDTSESYFTPTQPLSCMKCDNTYSASNEGRFFSPFVENGDGAPIFCDAVEMGGLRCDCQAICEDFVKTALESANKDCCKQIDFVEKNPQGLWDSRFMLVPLVSRNWKNLCWYGEIILGGTLCVVLTLPLAMVLADTLNSTPEHLIPT